MCPSLRVDHPAPATHHAGRTRVVKRATATSPHTSCRHVRCADRLIEGRHLHRPRGTRICHELLSPAPSVLALTIRVVPTGLPALLITPVHFAPPTPLALQPTRHAAIGMAAVARAADVEQTPTSAVTAKTLSENDFPTARAHSTVLSLDSTPAIVASFKPLVARASFAGGGPPKTPVALDDRGFFFARTISRKRVARLTARMMTGPAQLDGWSENCGFTGSATYTGAWPISPRAAGTCSTRKVATSSGWTLGSSTLRNRYPDRPRKPATLGSGSLSWELAPRPQRPKTGRPDAELRVNARPGQFNMYNLY